MRSDAAIAELRDALDADVLSRPDESGARQFADWDNTSAAVRLALIRPRSTDEVATAPRICHRHG
jgi:FAD/FMN-containing dehydrogenase